jgi:hypothetical protein
MIIQRISRESIQLCTTKVSPKDFDLTVHFNFYDIEFLLNKSKVLELGDVPAIIQKI